MRKSLRMHKAQERWHAESVAYRRQWENYALTHPYMSRYHYEKWISGYNWHNAAFILCELAGFVLVSKAPTAPCEVYLTSLHIYQDGDYIIIDYELHKLDDKHQHWIEVFWAGPHSPARHPDTKHSSYCGSWPEPEQPAIPVGGRAGTYTLFVRACTTQGLASPTQSDRVTMVF